MSKWEKNALVSRFKLLNCQICTFMGQYRNKSAVQDLKKYMTRYRILFFTRKTQKLETLLLVVWTWNKKHLPVLPTNNPPSWKFYTVTGKRETVTRSPRCNLPQWFIRRWTGLQMSLCNISFSIYSTAQQASRLKLWIRCMIYSGMTRFTLRQKYIKTFPFISFTLQAQFKISCFIAKHFLFTFFSNGNKMISYLRIQIIDCVTVV
jgi:hypothetical protein